jgi:hypothetical protein
MTPEFIMPENGTPEEPRRAPEGAVPPGEPLIPQDPSVSPGGGIVPPDVPRAHRDPVEERGAQGVAGDDQDHEGDEDDAPVDIDRNIRETLERYPQLEGMLGTGEEREEKINAMRRLVDPQSSPSQKIEAANLLNIPRSRVIEMLEVSGQNPDTVREVRERQEEMQPDEPIEVESEEEQRIVDEVQDMVSEAREALSSGDSVRIENSRNRIQDWMDENPGILNKLKPVGKFALGSLIITGLIYLMLLNLVAGGAAKRGGRG